MRFKKWLSQLLVGFIRTLNTIDLHLTNYAVTENPKGYEDLAPSQQIEKSENYFEALNYALRNKEIKNIALTGTYGSGKSSILKAYQAANKQYRYLNISLATFDDKVHDKEEDRQKIEISILQQMFYHVKHRDIPDSRFKRIRKLTSWQQIRISILTIVWIIAGGITMKINFFKGLPLLQKLETNENYSPIAFLLFVGGAILLIYYLSRSFRNTKFNKLNFIKGEIEISDLGDASVLNTYLDEILYFFEVNPFNVVIIEDLDRFQDPSIFTKLREINNLLNNSMQINRKVVFIYAIKDEMFVERNRAKFFEFIIPVIPVINSSNSLDIFLEKLNNADIKNIIDQDLLSVITSYIDDMRMLKNILNEYKLYKNILSDQLNQNELFCIIIYKNLNPRDFALLHLGKGMVYQTFSNKVLYIADFLKEIKPRIIEIKNDLDKANSIYLSNIQELRSVYILRIESYLETDLRIYVNVIETNNAAFLQEDKFNLLKTQNNIKSISRFSQTSNTGKSFAAIQTEVNPDKTYDERFAEITENSETHIADLKNELADLQKKVKDADAYTLSDILTIHSVDGVSEDLRKEKLLVYFLRNGFISETYYSYISYFYEGSITMEDRYFQFSIWNYEELPFTHTLIQTGELAKRITLAEFGQWQILNFTLLDFLLTNLYQHKLKRDAFFALLNNKKPKAIEFIDGYFQRGIQQDRFVKQLSNKWSEFWWFIQKESGYPEVKVLAYMDAIIRYADLSDLIALNKNNSLSLYIGSNINFLNQYNDPEIWPRIKEVISTLKISFIELVRPVEQSAIFDFIVDSFYYEINESMINTILLYKKPTGVSPADWEILMRTQNYSTIKATASTPLLSHIDANIDEYVTDVFLQISTNKNEPEATILALLKNTSVSETNKQYIVEQQEYIFESILSLPEDLWDKAMTANKVKPIWKNVIDYFTKVSDLDDTLISYLNASGNYTVLATQTIETDEETEEANITNLKELLLLSNDLTDESYTALLDSNDETYTNLTLSDLGNSKVAALISAGKLDLSGDNANALKTFNEDLLTIWLENNMDEFINYDKSDIHLDANDFARLLISSKITQDQKIVITTILKPEQIDQVGILARVLYEIFSTVDKSLGILKLVKVLHGLEKQEQKIHLLSTQIKYLTAESTALALSELGAPYSNIHTNYQTKLPDVDDNAKLANALLNRQFISSFNREPFKAVLKIYTHRKK